MNVRAAMWLLVSTLNVAACPATQEEKMDTKKDKAMDLASLEKELGVPLPKDAKLLWVDHQSGMDDLVRAKLQISRAAFDQIAPRLPIQESQLRKGPGRLGTDTGAWNPHQVPGLKSGSVALEGARFLHLGLADDGAGGLTLFIVNHGT